MRALNLHRLLFRNQSGPQALRKSENDECDSSDLHTRICSNKPCEIIPTVYEGWKRREVHWLRMRTGTKLAWLRTCESGQDCITQSQLGIRRSWCTEQDKRSGTLCAVVDFFFGLVCVTGGSWQKIGLCVHTIKVKKKPLALLLVLGE